MIDDVLFNNLIENIESGKILLKFISDVINVFTLQTLSQSRL